MDWKEVLEQKLKARGWNKREFAQKLGVSPQSLNNWIKRNSIPKYKVSLVASLLNINLNYLLRLEKVESTDLIKQVQLPIVFHPNTLPIFLQKGFYSEQMVVTKEHLQFMLGIDQDIDQTFIICGLSADQPTEIKPNDMVFIKQLSPTQSPKQCQAGFYLTAKGELVHLIDQCSTTEISDQICGRLLFVWGGQLFGGERFV